ncbi:MAG: MFS transporter [Gammaproteobacteria bacterium AqS3]|nr:MFS transporter [Gammaproteobacteria bacterium AqS3]
MSQEPSGSESAESMQSTPEQGTAVDTKGRPISKLYSIYALGILILVYVFNFLDRTILSILAEDLKRDLGLTDSQLGFLYGTAFAVFYAIFGIPLARLADFWMRGRLIALGLGTWSLMTALSASAGNLISLSIYRFGVGIGESSASPAAFSLLSDYFSPRVRATVMSLYSSGIYIGAGIGLVIGGLVVDNWNTAYPDTSAAPLGMAGWQAAFLVVGLPGLILAVAVWLLREPQRGTFDPDYRAPEQQESPVSLLSKELSTILPPFHFGQMFRFGGTPALLGNLGVLGLVTAVCTGLWYVSGDLLQWAALGIGAYAAISWVQSLKHRDRATFRTVFGSRALMTGILAFSCMSFVGYGAGFWGAPYFIRNFGMSETEVGLYLGTFSAVGGFAGITMGGWISDLLRQRIAGARPLTVMLAAPLTAIGLYVMIGTDNVAIALSANLAVSFFSTIWVGNAPSAASELVVPNMRATAGAVYILINTFIGLALGPYCIGKLSDLFEASGMDSASALGNAIGWSTAILTVTVIAAAISMRHYKSDEEGSAERAGIATSES